MPKVTTPREQETRRPTDRSPTHQRGPTHQAPSEGRSHPGTAGPQPHTGRAALLTHEACDYRNANRYARLGPNEQQAQEGNERQGRRPRAHTATGAPPTQRAAFPTPAPSRSRPPARSHSPAHPSSPRHELTSNSKLTSTKRVHETGRQESTAPRMPKRPVALHPAHLEERHADDQKQLRHRQTQQHGPTLPPRPTLLPALPDHQLARVARHESELGQDRTTATKRPMDPYYTS